MLGTGAIGAKRCTTITSVWQVASPGLVPACLRPARPCSSTSKIGGKC